MTDWEVKGFIDPARAKKVWADLEADSTHRDGCLCPSCKYQLHRARGGRFDKESFFLYWLELEAILALAPQIERITYPNSHTAGEITASLRGPWWKDLSRRRGVIKKMAEFLREHFPDAYRQSEERLRSRIKLKLWRFKKSGVDDALEEVMIGARRKKTAAGPGLEELRLAQRVADYILKRPGRTVTQREVRRAIQKPVQVIEGLRPWLFSNWGIVCERGQRKNQVLYRGTKTSRERYFRVGLGPSSKNEEDLQTQR